MIHLQSVQPFAQTGRHQQQEHRQQKEDKHIFGRTTGKQEHHVSPLNKQSVRQAAHVEMGRRSSVACEFECTCNLSTQSHFYLLCSAHDALGVISKDECVIMDFGSLSTQGEYQFWTPRRSTPPMVTFLHALRTDSTACRLHDPQSRSDHRLAHSQWRRR